MKRFKLNVSNKKRVISLIMTISLLLGLFGMVATAFNDDYDAPSAYDDVIVSTDDAASEAEESEPEIEAPAEEAEVNEPEYEVELEEETTYNNEVDTDSDSYTYNEEATCCDEEDYENEEYEYAEYDDITILIVQSFDGDVDVTIAPCGTQYVYNVEEDEEGNLEVAITFPPTTEGDIDDENVNVPSDWDFDIETDLSGYTTVTVYGFVPFTNVVYV
ncbi:MAG: hypothetical protein FWC68_06550, partial [Oscillospiraceae bacterium]|nr:hypothetical protein [Oscillospiraceae bacterium]